MLSQVPSHILKVPPCWQHESKEMAVPTLAKDVPDDTGSFLQCQIMQRVSEVTSRAKASQLLGWHGKGDCTVRVG